MRATEIEKGKSDCTEATTQKHTAESTYLSHQLMGPQPEPIILTQTSTLNPALGLCLIACVYNTPCKSMLCMHGFSPIPQASPDAPLLLLVVCAELCAHQRR